MSAHAHPNSVETLEPAIVWRYFAGISAVPRPSKREERIRAHVRGLAQEHGFAVREDAIGNLVIDVPATPGCERAPLTVLQGHLDMVCEKNADSKHDFDHDPLRLVLEEDADEGQLIVRADGTTLGADNGIGVALALAAATAPDVRHGPLEILCTVDEEAGMSGAKALQPDFLKGRRMLNLDSEEDNKIYIGCAGGCDVSLTWDFQTGPPPPGSRACRVTVKGLRGGHSGSDIHRNRGNAIKLLVQTLQGGDPQHLQLIELGGGSKRNAIPREAHARVAAPATTLEALCTAARQVQEQTVSAGLERNCVIHVEEEPDAAPALSPCDTDRLLTALTALPCGVLAVVPDIPGLIRTSNNVATVTADGGSSSGRLRLTVGCLARSSAADELERTVQQVMAVGRLAGATSQSGNGYPGWQPNMDSPMLATCRRVYERLFGEAPVVSAIHAGLECGLIGDRVPGMDMVSIGPRVEGGHSPDERVYVASVPKTWEYLKAILAELTTV